LSILKRADVRAAEAAKSSDNAWLSDARPLPSLESARPLPSLESLA
jgi:hypothetical protein